MNLDQAFNKYPENIFGFRTNKGTKIVDFWFNKDWEFPNVEPTEKPRYSLKKHDNTGDGPTYYIIFSDSLTFEDLFSEVSRVIDYNLDIEKKQKLFNQKVTDLKRLFVTLSYDELKELQIESPMTFTKSEEPVEHA